MSPSAAPTKFAFATGGTGFVGRRLIETLLQRGHRVRALVRGASENVQAVEQPAIGVRIWEVPDIRKASL